MKQSNSKLALSAVIAALLLFALKYLAQEEPSELAIVSLTCTAALVSSVIGVIGAIERLGERGEQRTSGKARKRSGS